MQILFLTKTGKLCIILAHFFINYLHNILRSNNPQKLFFSVKHWYGILRVVFQIFNTVLNFLIRIYIRIRCCHKRLQFNIIPCDNQGVQSNGAIKSFLIIHHIQRGNIIILRRLRYQLLHCLSDT